MMTVFMKKYTGTTDTGRKYMYELRKGNREEVQDQNTVQRGGSRWKF